MGFKPSSYTQVRESKVPKFYNRMFINWNKNYQILAFKIKTIQGRCYDFYFKLSLLVFILDKMMYILSLVTFEILLNSYLSRFSSGYF